MESDLDVIRATIYTNYGKGDLKDLSFGEWTTLVKNPNFTSYDLTRLHVQVTLYSVIKGQLTPSQEKELLNTIKLRLKSGDYMIEIEEPGGGEDYGDGEETDEIEEED